MIYVIEKSSVTDFLKKKGISFRSVEQKAGIANGYLHKIARLDSEPSTKTLNKIRQHLSVMGIDVTIQIGE